VSNVDEDELASLLDVLEQGLIQAGLSSLVNQERISAVEGMVEEVTRAEVDELRRVWSEQHSGRAPGVSAGEVRVRPLRADERLAGLLDLVEVAVGGTYAIEIQLQDDIKAALDEGENWTGQVIFADPPESQPVTAGRPEWSLPDQATLQQREAAVRRVISLVYQLREQAGLPRSDRLRSEAAPQAETGADIANPGDWL
jgi:hypothetical protein